MDVNFCFHQILLTVAIEQQLFYTTMEAAKMYNDINVLCRFGKEEPELTASYLTLKYLEDYTKDMNWASVFCNSAKELGRNLLASKNNEHLDRIGSIILGIKECKAPQTKVMFNGKLLNLVAV